jgi:O-methyltransferase
MRLAERVRKAKLQGCVHECGVWRGGMIAGLVTLLGSERDYFLFDRASARQTIRRGEGAGLAGEYGRHGIFDNCSAPSEFASEAMRIAGGRSFSLVKGWFNETVLKFKPFSSIACWTGLV